MAVAGIHVQPAPWPAASSEAGGRPSAWHAGPKLHYRPLPKTHYRPLPKTWPQTTSDQSRLSSIAAAGAGGSGPSPGSAAGTSRKAATAGSAAAGSGLPPSRLQQEVEMLLALDVEYTHLELAPGGRQVSLPAEVCAVDANGRVLLYDFCNPLEGELEQRRWRHVGGLHPNLWRYAPPLAELRQRLAELLGSSSTAGSSSTSSSSSSAASNDSSRHSSLGDSSNGDGASSSSGSSRRILVGHHLRKDLAALGLSHPEEATRDTLQYRELQGRRGSGRKLRDLSAEKLGRRIQRSGKRHSPREDAQAAMDLYLRHIHFERRYMQYEDLVAQHLADILSSADSGTDSGDEGSAGGNVDSMGGSVESTT